MWYVINIAILKYCVSLTIFLIQLQYHFHTYIHAIFKWFFAGIKKLNGCFLVCASSLIIVVFYLIIIFSSGLILWKLVQNINFITIFYKMLYFYRKRRPFLGGSLLTCICTFDAHTDFLIVSEVHITFDVTKIHPFTSYNSLLFD